MSDEEYIPRRMRRFQRDKTGFTEEEVKQTSTAIAIDEVDKFRKKNDRYPIAESEIEEISKNVFDQLKSDLDEKKTREEKISENLELDFGETQEETGEEESFLEKRKAKRTGQREKRHREKEKGKKQPVEEEAVVHEQPPTENRLGETSSLFDEEELNMGKGDELKTLAGIDELESLGENMEDDEFDLVEKETETTQNNCPFCNSKTKELIYCPDCGQAFCDHCAKAVEVLEGAVKYTCPKCGNEFKKRKKK